MPYKLKFCLFVFVVSVLLSLVSCSPKTNITQPPTVTSARTPTLQVNSTPVLLNPSKVYPTIVPRSGTTALPIPDGRIAFGDGNIQVFLTNSNEVFKVFSYEQEVQGIAISPESPRIAWSPDEQSIALVSGNSLLVMDADGKHRKLVKDFSPNTPTDLSWSPDGSTIALSIDVSTGKYSFTVTFIQLSLRGPT